MLHIGPILEGVEGVLFNFFLLRQTIQVTAFLSMGPSMISSTAKDLYEYSQVLIQN